MTSRVVILGGGIGGLSAAHELVERGYEVDVYESLTIPGGKARSVPVPGSGKDGRRDLPGEHGFRFFPRFYRHVVDTMRRIPFGAGRSVADNLVDTTRVQLCRFGKPPIEIPARFVRSLDDVRLTLDNLGRIFAGELGLSHEEIAFFASKVWQVITSCEERRATEYEKLAWWDFIEAEGRSEAYRALLGHGITRSLVAAKANQASTKTIGNIFVQLLFDIATPGPSTDRVLNGPTNDVWIEPWLDHLRSRGLRYHLGHKVVGVGFDGTRVTGVDVETASGRTTVTGDHFVFALPVEDIVTVLDPSVVRADPRLAALWTLDDITEWMNGIQIYLTEDVPLAHGHTIHVDSPWALTSISQAQFWNGTDLSGFGDGEVRGIISVDISEWEREGLNGKTAKDCSPEEVKAEVWAQLKLSHNHDGKPLLRDDQLHRWFLDPGLQLREGDGDTNEEPLLVNLVDTWKLRPDAVTAIPNLFLAADYVRTYTDLATMEAANEAARRAVNGILDTDGSESPRCDVWALHEPEIFAPWRELDRLRYRRGLPWDDTLVRTGLSLQRFLEGALANLGAEPERTLSASGLQAEAVDRMVSDLRREGTALAERIVRLAAAGAETGPGQSG